MWSRQMAMGDNGDRLDNRAVAVAVMVVAPVPLAVAVASP